MSEERLEWADSVVKGVAALLRARLPARLQAIELDRGDGVALEAPVDYYESDVATVQGVPAVEVWVPDSARVVENTAAFQYRHRVVVVLTVAGTDEVALDVQLKRSLLAMLQVLDGQTVAGADLIAGGLTYLLVEDGDNHPFTRSGSLELSATTQTDFGL